MRLSWISLLLLACQTEIPKPSIEADIEEYGGYEDQDGDGFGSEDDCDDNDPSVNSGIEEICDGIDNDCDGEIDEGVTETFYADADEDGFGDNNITVEACESPSGHVPIANDCDDTNVDVHPDVLEVALDGVDQNCDGLEDCYEDGDEDGYGSSSLVSSSDLTCSSQGVSINSEDCNDADSTISPKQTRSGRILKYSQAPPLLNRKPVITSSTIDTVP